MLVAMDVAHLGKGSLKGIPSISAVLASTNDVFAQFPAGLSLQGMYRCVIFTR